MPIIVYTNCPTLQPGCFLYDSPLLNAPATGAPGFYSDGIKVYTVIASGMITQEQFCSALTTTTTTTALPGIVTTGLQVYIDPSVRPPVNDIVYDVKNPSSPVVCGYISNPTGFYNSTLYSGGIFQLNGTDQWINLFKVATNFYYTLTFTTGFTFQIVMRKSNAGGFKNGSTFIGNNQVGTRLGGTCLNRKLKVYDNAFATNHFYYENGEGGSGYTEFSSPDNGNTNWHMYTFVSTTGSNFSSPVLLYVDNSSTPYSVPDRSITAGCFEYLVLGNFDNGGGNSFKGDIGAFTFYDGILTQQQISQNYTKLMSRFLS